MARTYRRDARGRFAGGGFSGQSGGRGARLKAKGSRDGGGAKTKAARRSTPSGAIRKTDVIQARVSNGISRNIERRNKAGLNPSTAAKENNSTRVNRAAGRIAARKTNRGPMSAKEKDALGMAKGDLAVNKQRLQAARKQKSGASNALEKIKASAKVGEYQLNVSRASNRVKRITARPIFGTRPTTGRGSAQKMTGSRSSRPGGIRGRVTRDRSAASRMPSGANLQAGRFKNIYIDRANTAASRANARRR